MEDNAKLIADPVYESRKIKLARQTKVRNKSRMNIRFSGNCVLLKVAHIGKSKYTGDVYNFECETHTFGCRCIMTHNCDPLTQSQAGLKSSKNGETLEQTTPC